MNNLNGGESPIYTLVEACELARIPRPMTAKDLSRTALRLSQEGIRTNLDEERFWKDAIKAQRWTNINLAHFGRASVSQLPAYTEAEVEEALKALEEA